MMKRSTPFMVIAPATGSRPQQQGVVLIVALILLVVMTLAGLAGLRTVLLEEKMTANTYDRSLSFQAAESGLRQAEAVVAAVPPPTPAASAACAAGVCPAPAATATPRWENTGFTGWQNASTVVNGGISITPQYLIEYMGSTYPCQPGSPGDPMNCKRYRITARSNAGADRAVVILQSMYATE